MSGPFGVTSTGFIAPALSDVLAGFASRLVQAFGISLDTSPQSVIGQLYQGFAEREIALWQLARKVSQQLDPMQAVGTYLDVLCAFTGTTRKPATFSTVSLLAVGTTTTVIPIGSSATNTAAENSFLTTAGGTLGAATAWATGQSISLLDVRKNSTHVYVAITAGTTLGSGSGPLSTSAYPLTIVDNTVTWVYVGEGTGFAYIPAQASVTGPAAGPAFSLNRIGTPISGWAAVANPNDAVIGQNIESDSALRLRRVIELKGIGGSTVDAIRAAISALTSVTAVTVFENATDATVGTMGPHTIEALVSGSASATDICTAIYSKLAAGIDTVGANTFNVPDSQSLTHLIRYSIPTTVDIYCAVVLTVDGTAFPSDGDVTAAALILAFGNALAPGYDVESIAISGALFIAKSTGDLPGLLTSSVQVDTVAITGGTPVNGSVPIDARAVAVFDSSRIAVTIVQRAP
jgi:uncharacterized phage protein gp47/JayE